jgi:hypothetical protein
MKVVILVLSTDNKIYNSLEQTIRETWANYIPDNVEIFYYYGGAEKFNVVGDRIFCKTKESFENIGYKTLDSFEYIYDNFEFDYIFRTNSSSYVNIDKMLKFLEDKNREKFYCARVNTEVKSGIIFGSGSGYFLSKDVVKLVLEISDKWNHNLIDDVALGKLLLESDIKIFPSKRFDINNLNSIDVSRFIDHFHFRCKSLDHERIEDSDIINFLHKHFNSLN